MTDDLDFVSAVRPEPEPEPTTVDRHRTQLQRAIVASSETTAVIRVGEPVEDVELGLHRVRGESRRTRYRMAAALGTVVAVGVLALSLIEAARDETVTTDSPPASTSSSLAPTEYGFAPLTPLVDAPLPVVPPTELTVTDGHVLSVESAPDALSLRLTDATGASAAMSADREAMPALISMGSGPSSNDPVPKHYIAGITRAEVARVDWVRESGTVSVQTIGHDAFPQLRFFLIEDTAGEIASTRRTAPFASDQPRPEVPFLIAYAADGTLLTDSERIDAEQDAFYTEVDRRKGVEEKAAGVRDVRVSNDDQSLTLTVFNCGEEPFPAWTIDESTVRISVTVKRPYSEDDCLAGETVEANIGLDERLSGRTIIDDRAGEPIPLRTEP